MSKRLSKKHYVAIEKVIAKQYQDALFFTKSTVEYQQDAGRYQIRALDAVIAGLGEEFMKMDPTKMFDRELFARLCRGEEA